MNDLIPVEEVVPAIRDDWDYEESVKTVKPILGRWKREAKETILPELWNAHEHLDGRDGRNLPTLKAQDCALKDKTFAGYCSDIGIHRNTGRNWLIEAGCISSKEPIDVTPANEITEDYQIVYADPPWSYGNSATRANANSHYPTMSIQDICDYKPDDENRVEEIVDDNAVLFMWVTPPLLPEVWEIYGAWGFEYKTVAFNWVKLNSDESVYLGIGNYTRSNVEYLTVGVRKGKDSDHWVRRQRNDISNVVMAKRLEHSEKPHVFRSLIEEMYGEVKRIELFARTKTPGWDVSGNQIKQELLDGTY